MSDRPFSHPHFGNEARIEQWGKEVRLIFVSGTQVQADDFFEMMADQLKAGALNVTLMGKATSVEEI